MLFGAARASEFATARNRNNLTAKVIPKERKIKIDFKILQLRKVGLKGLRLREENNLCTLGYWTSVLINRHGTGLFRRPRCGAPFLRFPLNPSYIRRFALPDSICIPGRPRAQRGTAPPPPRIRKRRTDQPRRKILRIFPVPPPFPDRKDLFFMILL